MGVPSERVSLHPQIVQQLKLKKFISILKIKFNIKKFPDLKVTFLETFKLSISFNSEIDTEIKNLRNMVWNQFH